MVNSSSSPQSIDSSLPCEYNDIPSELSGIRLGRMFKANIITVYNNPAVGFLKHGKLYA